MAINPESQYPGKIAPSTAAYPYGQARNITVPGDGTGTPWEAALVNDLFGFQQALLSTASIVPSGTPETAQISQYLEALKKITIAATDYVFDSTTNMQAGVTVGGAQATFSEGQLLHVSNNHFYVVIDGTGYTAEPGVDYVLGDGLVAQRRSDGTLAVGRDNHPRPTTEPTTGPVETLTEGARIKDRKIKAWVNPVVNITSKDNKVENVHFAGWSDTEQPNNCAYFREGSVAPIVDGNYFDRCNYQIVQATGEFTYGVRITSNTSIDSSLDFILQNNDFQNGITHSWIVTGNYVDQTDSEFGYGQTESRGIGFTSCYGGMVVANAMVACKGDAATHLENIQETVYLGNYYRDNQLDVLFSGLPDRRLVRLNVTVGSVAVGQSITDSVSGATGEVLFWLDDGNIAQIIDIAGGQFEAGNAFTTDGGASGTIVHNDPVQSHSNHIGNVYHKTNDDTSVSFSSSGGPYTLRSYYLGNTWNNQGNRAGKTAMSFPARFDVSSAFNAFRGWGTALSGGGSTASSNDFLFNKYWGNEKNVDGNIVTGCKWLGEKFYDGEFEVADLRNSVIDDCVFFDGEIDIQSTTNDNVWRNNRVSPDVTLTNLDLADFKVWESKHYKKNGSTHAITSSTSITSGSTAAELIATLSGGANRSAVIEWRMSSRSASSGGRRRADMGRAFLDWNNAGTPSITLDPANFQSGSPVMDLLIAVNGTDVELSFDFQFAGSTSQASVEISLVAEAVSVVPVKYLDGV